MKRFKLASVLFVFLISISVMANAAGRDWEKYPAYIEITGARQVCAIGDIHGAFDEFAASLEALKLAVRTSKDSFRFKWTGGETVLVLTGDLNDRGLHSKQSYDAVMDLQQQAEKAGGRLIELLGNHEVMLLNGQIEEWAKTLKPPKKQHYQNTLDSFTRDGLDFQQAISENGVYGRWIRNLPMFAIINGYMFNHAGLANKPLTRSTLAADFKDDTNTGDYKKGIFMNTESYLWNRDWWNNNEIVDQNLKMLGVMGIVFGHTVGALGTKGTIQVKDNRIISIDLGMTPAYGNSKGGGLMMNTVGDQLNFKAVYPDRPEENLFSVKIPAAAYRAVRENAAAGTN